MIYSSPELNGSLSVNADNEKQTNRNKKSIQLISDPGISWPCAGLNDSNWSQKLDLFGSSTFSKPRCIEERERNINSSRIIEWKIMDAIWFSFAQEFENFENLKKSELLILFV